MCCAEQYFLFFPFSFTNHSSLSQPTCLHSFNLRYTAIIYSAQYVQVIFLSLESVLLFILTLQYKAKQAPTQGSESLILPLKVKVRLCQQR